MRIIVFLVVVAILLGSCATSKWKMGLVSEGNSNDAVNNVIIDFLHTSRLSKKDSVFDIVVTDINDEILIIGIGSATNKIYPSPEYKDGYQDKFIPSQYAIKEGKLFYWKDTTKIADQEIIAVFKRYNQIDFHWSEESAIPPFNHDDGKEAVIYFICKNNYRNYKKTRVNTISKHYKTPTPACTKH